MMDDKRDFSPPCEEPDLFLIGRRNFLKTSAFLGSSALLSSQIRRVFDLMARAEAQYLTPTGEYALAKAENILHTVCLNCHVRCAIRAKIFDGVVVKIDGSPFAAKNFLPNIPYETPLHVEAAIDGKVCPKGQAGVQILYDPYRIRKVLKREGPRGSGRWKTVDFETAISEIVEGGYLFGEDRVPGLQEIWAIKDPDITKAMAEDIKRLKRREITLGDFRSKHGGFLHLLIDPEHPDLGPVNNQFVFMAGRIQHGRKEFAKRFVNDAFGSVNFFEHTSICEQSHHIATERVTWDPAENKGKTHLKPDFLNAEFVIFWGTGAFEANFGSAAIAELVTRAMAERNLKFAVIDPRLSKTAAKSWRWIPIRPGADAALALAMMRWIIENDRYDKRYLENANKDAAKGDGEPTFTDATHLVRTDRMVLLRGEDAGLPVGEEEKGGPDRRLVMTPEGVRYHDEVEHGLLDVSSEIGGVPMKSVFSLLRERAYEKTLDEYADIAGVPVHLIEELAAEFTSHGKKAAIDTYRGAVQHTNGYYNQQTILALDLLIGSVDWKGGLSSGAGHWHEMGEKEGQPFSLKELHPAKLKSFGVPLTREKWKYEESTLFDKDRGYPAKRPWYPFTSNIYQEVIPSADEGYPYPIKFLWIHKGTPILSCPGGSELIRIIRDPQKIPLVIADDILIGETSMFADYIFPDLTFLERWGAPHDNPQPAVKNSLVRQPVASPIPEIVTIDEEEMPISMEAMMIAIASKLRLPGFGKDGFGPGMDLKRPEDFYLKMAANIASGDKPGDGVPDADKGELDLFLQARRHLPPSVFSEEKWKRAVGDELWPKVIYVLNRGGRSEHFSRAYDGDYMTYKFGKRLRFFIEEVAEAKNSISAEHFDGLPRYDPPANCDGKELEQGDYDLHLITYKEIFGGHSRTIPTYWTNIALQPENFVLINRRDADRMGVRDGDQVKLVSKANPDGIWPIGNGLDRPVAGKAKVIEGIMPGVVAVSWHYGHWAYGAGDVIVDGQRIKGDPRRGRGLCPNALMLLDDRMKTTCLTDPVGGSASFYDSKVRLIKF